MKENSNTKNLRLKEIAVFCLSCLVALFIFLMYTIDVYKYAIVGVFAELFWLPALVLLFALPILTIFVIISKHGKVHKLWYLSLGIQILTLTFRFLI